MPQRWSVSLRIDLAAVGRRAGRRGSRPSGFGEIQSAGLSNRVWFEPPLYWKVMPTGCCFGLALLVLVDEADHVVLPLRSSGGWFSLEIS